jgi:Mn-containing catalase
MYHHIKKLMYTVNVGNPDLAFSRSLEHGRKMENRRVS